jgi:hypothetical protein
MPLSMMAASIPPPALEDIVIPIAGSCRRAEVDIDLVAVVIGDPRRIAIVENALEPEDGFSVFFNASFMTFGSFSCAFLSPFTISSTGVP